MKATIYRSVHAEAALSNEAAASSYGQPVLLVEDDPYGPGDTLPSGLPAGDFVRRYLDRGDAGGGEWVESADGDELAWAFLVLCLRRRGLRGGQDEQA